MNTTHNKTTIFNTLDHTLARLGVRRGQHRVKPGLYEIGEPKADSPVLVTANYSLSFDALRSSIPGIAAFILVLDTKGVNVWCAAGKGTFGTDEIIKRIDQVGLSDVVSHRRIIVPQLGAPGVAAHEVEGRTGFRVEFGPVDAADLPEYLQTRTATPAMRRVKFGIKARSVLVPIEAVHVVLPVLIVSLILRFTDLSDHIYNVVLAGVLAGNVISPLLLPWLPTRDFTTKGYLAGVLAWLPIVWRIFAGDTGEWWSTAASAVASLLVVSTISAFLALNFTGSTTFTSRSGVRREIFRYIPGLAWIFSVGIALYIVTIFI